MTKRKKKSSIFAFCLCFIIFISGCAAEKESAQMTQSTDMKSAESSAEAPTETTVSVSAGSSSAPAETTVPVSAESSSAQEEDIPADAAASALMDIYYSREFTEERDMSEHPGLVSANDVTGPFLEIKNEAGGYFVPDRIGSETEDNPAIPADCSVVPAGDKYLPGEYVSLIQTEEKTAAARAGDMPVVYALLEYLGYGVVGEYSGSDVYYYKTRVSFYSMETGEMLGWMATSERREGPMVLYSDDTVYDGQHSVLKFETSGTGCTDAAWGNALKELFYDENGYEVINGKLLSVPEDADPIIVPEGVTEIDKFVGRWHDATEVILPEGLRIIGQGAFERSDVERINFPDTLVYCDQYVLLDTPWMEANSEEEWLIVGDGVLLRCSCKDEELVVPEEVHYIMPEAFTEIEPRKITIPSSVIQCCGGGEYVGGYDTGQTDYAIKDIDSLEELVLEGGLTAAIPGVKINVLRFCGSLKTITVACESDELHEEWIWQSRDDLENLTIICPDDSPAAEWAEDNGVKHQKDR